MSSNYLDYVLSKELHRLGVTFECDAHYVIVYSKTHSYGVAVLSHSGDIKEGEIVAPSTAQLLDALRSFNLEPTDDGKYGVTLLHEGIMFINKCATTGLGEALIALTKRGKNGT